jgi:hypothetical protein
MTPNDEQISRAADALRIPQPLLNHGAGMLEPSLGVSQVEADAVAGLLKQPRYAEAAKRLFPDVPPAPRPSLESMRAELARISGRPVPQAEPPVQPVAQPAPVEPSLRDKVIAAHAQPTALPRGMESPQ